MPAPQKYQMFVDGAKKGVTLGEKAKRRKGEKVKR